MDSAEGTERIQRTFALGLDSLPDPPAMFFGGLKSNFTSRTIYGIFP